MKTLQLITALLCLALFSSCRKNPEAAFASDRSFYYVGETIHLKNESADAASYRWYFPDGTFSSEKDASYTVDDDSKGSPIPIFLNAYKKNGKDASTATKYFVFSRAIYASDYYQVDGRSCKPFMKYMKNDRGMYRLMVSESYKDPTYLTYKLSIMFNGGSYPKPGVYTMSQVRIGIVSEIGEGNAINQASNTGDEGFFTVSQTTDGKLRLKFDKIKIAYMTNTSAGDSYGETSGDITF